ncbi:MAG: molybdenum cofactor guanylyltransferase [Nitrospira sp.]|nr:molybdenum cofactor guanylyltransferase [Nitrospira sp.]MDH4369811.1 molybdenum cofactor guanylyltransferase [Nitrospira sp.]MDH5496897.1 molybdenum cofactor guanylyltransferase [Nitrospira sp.]
MLIADVTGVLLGGGKSTRMGRDKRFLSIGGQTLLERGLCAMCALFQRVCVVIGQDSLSPPVEVPVFRDVVPDCGSLGGLYTGLCEASTSYIFVAACDMPFLNANLVKYMIGLKEEADIVVASWKTRLQPTHAIYSKRCMASFEDMIRRQDVKIQAVFQQPSLSVRFMTENEVSQIDPEGRSFININNPADLEAARLLHGDPAHS